MIQEEMKDLTEREDGYYWVKREEGVWEIACWDTYIKGWWVGGTDNVFDTFETVNENKLIPPQ